MKFRGTWLLGATLLTLSAFKLPTVAQSGTASLAQAHPPQSAPSSKYEANKNDEITLRGCVEPEGIDTPLGYYRLTGDTSVLRAYPERYVAIRARSVAKVGSGFVAEFVRLVEVLPKPIPRLNPSVKDSSDWQEHTNKNYGVRFAIPDLFSATAVSSPFEDPDFVDPEGTIPLASFSIPGHTYSSPRSAASLGYSRMIFAGGFFGLFVNPTITNAPSCLEFSNSYHDTSSWRVAGGARYRESDSGSAAAGTAYGFKTFHTFQNGYCYAATVELTRENGAIDGPFCLVPFVTAQQSSDLAQRLLSRVAFFRPDIRPRPAPIAHSAPAVRSFTASALVADSVANRGSITFSWSTQGADYVVLSYGCSGNRLVILEQAKQRECEGEGARGSSSPAYSDQAVPVNRSPNSSVEIGFGNMRGGGPIPVRVTLTPFLRAVAYPAASKTITITVNPYNPFVGGVPTETKNIEVLSPVSTGEPPIFKQGSPLTIRWKDSLKSDRCINLYLVQDRPGAAPNYLTQIGGCISSAENGSYTWTIPSDFAGSGFRILLSSPGSHSNALTIPFRIAP